jgi:putative transposase
MKFQTHSHSIFKLKIHLIVVVAYRRKVISSLIMQTLRETITEVCESFSVNVLEFSGEMDHVHLLLEIVPTIRISDLVRTIKSVTSRRVREKHWSEIKSKLWGKRFWTRSYCVLSVGDGANTEIIKKYIQNQCSPS